MVDVSLFTLQILNTERSCDAYHQGQTYGWTALRMVYLECLQNWNPQQTAAHFNTKHGVWLYESPCFVYKHIDVFLNEDVGAFLFNEIRPSLN